MPVKKLVLATCNRDKVEELRGILGGGEWELVSMRDFPDARPAVEDGETLLENALKKTRACRAHTGLPSVADDTGLEVDALGGRPGVHSSRYAGEDASYKANCEKLVAEMRGVPTCKRTARFRCVAAFTDGSGEYWTEGVCEGVILDSPRGGNGFGYDPVFFVPETGKTLAQMSLDEKNGISHRAIAFRRMAEVLKKLPK
jgi:XTP/dITP diphosphohydrolase